MNTISLANWEQGYISATGVLTNDDKGVTSEYIGVTQGVNYTINFPSSITAYRFATFDSNKNYIERYLNQSSLNIPVGVSYIRITVGKSTGIVNTDSDLANVYLSYQEGSSESSIFNESFSGKFEMKNVINMRSNNYNAHKFFKKKYYSLGDSIVANDSTYTGYQTHIAQQYGTINTNYGDGGKTIVDKLEKYLSLDYSDVALVTIGFGVNDARTNIPLGTLGSYGDDVSTFDGTTFIGAYRKLLTKIYTDNPLCRVVLLTPIQRLEVNGFGCDTTNSNGNKLVDYADAIIKIGEMYATPVCDMYRNSGANQVTLGSLTVEGVHPKEKLYVRMACMIMHILDQF